MNKTITNYHRFSVCRLFRAAGVCLLLAATACPAPKLNLTVSPASLEIKQGATQQLKVSPPEGTAEPLTYRFWSNNKSVASVSKSGAVKGEFPGKTTVSVVASNGAEATVPVRVMAAELTLSAADVVISNENQSGFSFTLFDSESRFLERVQSFLPEKPAVTLDKLTLTQLSLGGGAASGSGDPKCFLSSFTETLKTGSPLPKDFFGTVQTVSDASPGDTFTKAFSMTLSFRPDAKAKAVEIPLSWAEGLADTFKLPLPGDVVLSDGDISVKGVSHNSFTVSIALLKQKIKLAVGGGESGEGTATVVLKNNGSEFKKFESQSISDAMELAVGGQQPATNYVLTVEITLSLTSGKTVCVTVNGAKSFQTSANPNDAPQEVTSGTMHFTLLKAFNFNKDDEVTLPTGLTGTLSVKDGTLVYKASGNSDQPVSITLGLNLQEQPDYIQMKLSYDDNALVWVQSGVYGKGENQNIYYTVLRKTQIGTVGDGAWRYAVQNHPDNYFLPGTEMHVYGIYNHQPRLAGIHYSRVTEDNNPVCLSTKGYGVPFAKDGAVFSVKGSQDGNVGVPNFTVEYIAFYKGDESNLPAYSSADNGPYYRLLTPKRGNQVIKEAADTQDCTYTTGNESEQATWFRLVKRDDTDKFDLVSKSGKHLYAESGLIKASASQFFMWQLSPADKPLGTFLIIGTWENHYQINMGVDSNKVNNWGWDTGGPSGGRAGDFNYRDDGCGFQFKPVP